MDKEIIQYSNYSEFDSEKILMEILNIIDGKIGALFINISHDEYNCICHINKDIQTDIQKDDICYKIFFNGNSLDEKYTAPYTIENIITIPIKKDNRQLGVLCLINQKNDYDINKINIYMFIIELILTNKIIKQEYEMSIKNIKNNDKKDFFLTNMSHEIRTPANGVIGYGQLLMQTELTSLQKKYLQSQNQCCIQLMHIINDILDFSKISSGKMSLNIECFCINELIETIQNTIGIRINEKKQKIYFHINPNVPTFMTADKQKITQILINLVSNAYKFTDIGGKIDIFFEVISSEKLQIIVKDNGIGISEEDIENLFVPFQQKKNQNYKSGTGLGLTISQKLANLMNGKIYVKSQLNVGSQFVVIISFQNYNEYEKNMKNNLNIMKDKVILVVDDNTDNRIILTDILFEWNMKPVVCASAIEALRMMFSNNYTFSLGLIDICMPNISGTELAQQIKEEFPFFPMIALSSIDSFTNTCYFKQKLDKPINKIQLFNAIHKVLSENNINNPFIGDELNNNSNNNNHKKSQKILIVEDVNYNKVMLENMIEKLNYNNIKSIENGKLAIEEIQKAYSQNIPYDIILLDIRMPIMNGYEVIQKIIDNSWNIKNIVVITASVMDEDKEKCKKLGIQYFITKPIEMQHLKNVLSHINNNN